MEAIDYDLLTLGLDIRWVGTSDLTWRRLRSVITYLPSTSALGRSVNGDAAVWGTTEYLLAHAVDELAAANWQRGGKGPRPKPIPRPGADDPGTRKLGTGRMTLGEAQAFFDRINRAS